MTLSATAHAATPHVSFGTKCRMQASGGPWTETALKVKSFFRTPSRCSTQALITSSSQNSRSLVALHRCDEKGKKGKSLASQCADHIVNGQPEGSLQVCSLRNIDSQTPRTEICQASPLQVLSCCDCRIQATTVSIPLITHYGLGSLRGQEVAGAVNQDPNPRHDTERIHRLQTDLRASSSFMNSCLHHGSRHEVIHVRRETEDCVFATCPRPQRHEFCHVCIVYGCFRRLESRHQA